DIISYMSKETGYDLKPIFDLFLNYTEVPQLEYRVKKAGKGEYILEYKWNTSIEGFNMGMRYSNASGESNIIYPTDSWQKTPINSREELTFAEDLFYFEAVELK